MTAIEQQPGEQRSAADPDAARAPDTLARQRVEEVSLDLFGRRGYETVSLRQIADVVGIHKSSIFHYYRKKRDLAAEVLRGAMARLRDRLLPLVEDEHLTLEKGLEVLDDVVDHFADRPEDARLVLTYLCAPDDSDFKIDPSARSSHPGRQAYEILALALDRAQRRGVIGKVEPDQVLFSLVGLLLVYPAMAGNAEQRLFRNGDPFSPEARAARKRALRQQVRALLTPE